jgi:C1A family cysteine protease
MKRREVQRFMGLLLIAAILLPVITSSAVPVAQSSDIHTLSPISPKFAKWLEDYRGGGLDTRVSQKTLGYVPPIVDLSHTRGMQIEGSAILKSETYSNLLAAYNSPGSTLGATTSSSLPSRYDLRTTGKLSAVKDQGQCGSCWAFSTLASLESTLLPGEFWDFSENNMRNTHGFDLSSCQGGNSVMAAAYLTRWSGVIPETSDPYAPVSKIATSMTVPNTGVVKHVQEILFIPERSGWSDNANIKKVLVEKGAVYSSVRWEDSNYQAGTASYYYPGLGSPNHAVTIVGWDDSYDRTRFSPTPPGNGAFIVKNSWGTTWGEGGYFYVSYYDSQIGQDNAVVLAESAQNYYHIYQYDPLGWTVSYGGGSDTVYFGNIFTAQAAESLAAVSFYTPTMNTQYKVSVYKNNWGSPVAGSALVTDSGTIAVPGYHTLTLSKPVSLNQGEKFSVVVRLYTPGYQYPVALEYPYAGYSSQATAKSGESFVSNDGITWTDVTTVYRNANVCLKAFTRQSGQATPVVSPTYAPAATPTPSTVTADTTPPTLTFSAPSSYAVITPGQSLAITWSATDSKGVAGVDIDFSTDSGRSYTVIIANQGRAGTFSWTVPSTTATSLTLRVKARDISGNVATASKICFVRAASAATSTGKSTSSGKSLIVLVPGETRTARTVTPIPTLTLRLSGSAGTEKPSLSGFFF